MIEAQLYRGVDMYCKVLACTLATTAIILAGNPPNNKRESENAKARIFETYWMEVRVEDSQGATDDPLKLACFGYDKDKIVVWGRRGELSLGRQEGGRVLVKADVDPMQIDFFFTAANGQDWVAPGIFKFDGNKLVIVEPTEPSVMKYRKDGAYPNRPSDFIPTKKNKCTKRTLVACKLYDQD